MIPQTSEYALRAAVYLAQREDDRPAAAQEISEAVQVPLPYLQRILRSLAQHGILVAHRGSTGGFALAKVASAISVLDVLRAAGMPVLRIERCPLGIKGHIQLCPLHRMLDDEMARTERAFAAASLADFVASDLGIIPLCPLPETAKFPPAPKVAALEPAPRKRVAKPRAAP